MKLSPLMPAMAVFSVGVMAAADEPVTLKPSPPLTRHVAAFPRIAAPAGAAAQRINLALDRQDDNVKSVARQCAHDGWSRDVTVTMRGPRYLSLTAQDSWYCGGAYPDAGRLVLVYDLDTGSPVNWARLLPAAMIGSASLDTAGDGTRIGVIQSRVLQDYYVKTRTSDPKDPLDADCRDVVQDPALKFTLWPDAHDGGIRIEPVGLPHVVAVCGGSVLIPAAALRRMGVQPSLADAIESAHARGWFGKP
jgi:hypothetical protein